MGTAARKVKACSGSRLGTMLVLRWGSLTTSKLTQLGYGLLPMLE
jgi:hypothetical protein